MEKTECRKNAKLTWDFLITCYEVHLHTPIVEPRCLLGTDLTPVFDPVYIGILESTRVDARCLIRESTGRTRRDDRPEIGGSIPLIVSPAKCTIPVVDRICSFCERISSDHFQIECRSYSLYRHDHLASAEYLRTR